LGLMTERSFVVHAGADQLPQNGRSLHSPDGAASIDPRRFLGPRTPP
jgi:hypothetical protein